MSDENEIIEAVSKADAPVSAEDSPYDLWILADRDPEKYKQLMKERGLLVPRPPPAPNERCMRCHVPFGEHDQLAEPHPFLRPKPSLPCGWPHTHNQVVFDCGCKVTAVRKNTVAFEACTNADCRTKAEVLKQVRWSEVVLLDGDALLPSESCESQTGQS